MLRLSIINVLHQVGNKGYSMQGCKQVLHPKIYKINYPVLYHCNTKQPKNNVNATVLHIVWGTNLSPYCIKNDEWQDYKI